MHNTRGWRHGQQIKSKIKFDRRHQVFLKTLFIIELFLIPIIVFANLSKPPIAEKIIIQDLLPKAEIKKKEVQKEIRVEEKKVVIREVSAYNAGDPAQTNSSPCISANGENICEALSLGYKRCAANFVKFGTILNIENYGDCLVVDRMNSRYKNSVDIAFSLEEKERALKFGRQKLAVSVK